MPLLLPNLDDRMWTDLVDEGRALIPVYGSEWTDHNASDPGMTLVELLAWFAEMDIFSLNQITDAERLRFLALVDVKPRGPQPADAVLSFSSATGTPTLARTLEFSGLDANKVETCYQITREILVSPGALSALQYSSSAGFQDLTTAWKRRSPMLPFGPAAEVGAAFYLGLTAPLPVNSPASFYFTFGDGFSGPASRNQIIEEAKDRERACRSAQLENFCCTKKHSVASNTDDGKSAAVLGHYGVRTIWEYLTLSSGTPQWIALNSANDEVVDETRAFTLDGPVTFRIPAPISQAQLGSVPTALYYLRCRIDAGRYDAAPVLSDAAFNAVRAVQQVPFTSSFVVSADCAITFGSSGPPKPLDRASLRMQFDRLGRIAQLDFTPAAELDPEFTIVDFKVPVNKADGCLILQAASLGYGNGLPAQRFTLPRAPVAPQTVRVYTLEKNNWRSWELREDFLASTRRDFHAVLDPATGVLTFGDGEHGRVPPRARNANGSVGHECLIFVSFESTRAQNGNLAAKQVGTLVDSPRNRALLSAKGTNPNGWTTLNASLASITNPLPCIGGTAAETLDHAGGRTDQLVETTDRAVTLADYERLALSTPGTRIARVSARANLHPDFPCYKAPGMITVIILPFLPAGKPVPTRGLIRAVSTYLRPRRVIGTRVEVVGPTYLEVAVNAVVQSQRGADKTALQQRLLAALNAFLDPLKGGPDGAGWPFGRDVYRAEILRILSEVDGVDYVFSHELVPGHGPAQCGNICLAPTWLVVSGAHQVQVL
jgi:Baseplate J-like protein